MPRETVRLGDKDVHVGWDRHGGGAQIAVELRHDGPGIHEGLASPAHMEGLVAYARELFASKEKRSDVALGRLMVRRLDRPRDTIEITNAHTGETHDEPLGPEYFGVWASIDDRRAINDLIKLLRRARDAAFGRDE